MQIFRHRFRLGWFLLVASSRLAAAAPAEGGFVDANGRWRLSEPTFDRWFRQPRGRPHYLLAALENVAIVGAGTAWYWARVDFNRRDWDRPSLADRLTLRAFRFDNNDSMTNHVAHPLAGSGYYGMARVSNLGVLASVGYSFAGSTLWEFGLEWRELASINDMVFTGGAGIALGEVFFQLGEYFTSGPGRWPYRLGTYTVGAPRLAHQAAFHEWPPGDLPLDEQGFTDLPEICYRGVRDVRQGRASSGHAKGAAPRSSG